ncbi:hypothetical protein [Serratia quinivorans]|uniref:hypothetical protein n=1 Tax=Serratia quinivorans TaxID=137545 RepID=UPI0034C6C2B4
MTIRYTPEVYNYIVTGLITAHFHEGGFNYPSSQVIHDSMALGLRPFELVNQIVAGYLKGSFALTDDNELTLVGTMIIDSQLIINREHAVNKIREGINPEILNKIDNWKEQKYSESAREFDVRFECVNIDAKEIVCELRIMAFSELDAAFIFGQRYPKDNYFIVNVKEVKG